MSKTEHAMPPAPSHQILRNRVFNCRMRNKHYERAFMLFRRIQGLLRTSPTLSEHDHLQPLKEFLEHLVNCQEYAEASIFAGKRKHIGSFADDRIHGILREEIILAHFLSEMVSSVRYVIDRIETDRQLQEFGRELEGTKTKGHSHPRGGFVDGVLSSLSALQETGAEEFARIYSTINQRYEIGNKLFSLIRELQKFQ